MEIDPIQATRFLEALTGDPATPCTWQTFDDKGENKTLTNILHGPFTKVRKRLEELNAQGAGIFVTGNKTDLRGRTKDHIVAARAVWVDSDEGPLPPVPVKPSILVKTRAGVHAYWLLEEGESLEEAEKVMRALAKKLHTDASVADMSRVLRVPGFYHNKQDPFLVTIAELNGEHPTTLDEIKDFFGLQVDATQQPKNDPTLDAIRVILESIDRTVLIDKCRKYLKKVPPAVEGENGDDATYKACAVGGDFGLTKEEFLPLVTEWNNTCKPPWDKDKLIDKIEHAYTYRTKPIGIKIASWAAKRQEVKDKGAFLRKARQDSEANLCDAFIDTLRSRDSSGLVMSTGNAMYCYNSDLGIWKKISEPSAIDSIRRFDGATVIHDGKPVTLSMSANKEKGIFYFALNHSEIYNEEFFNEQTPGIVFKNGFARIDENGVWLEPYSPDHRALHAFNFDYDASADKPEWISMLGRLFNGDVDAEDKRKVLQEFVGACLCGIATKYDLCVVLVGGGGNGKSTFQFAVTNNLFPKDAIGCVAPQRWGMEQYLSSLHGKLINIVPELPNERILASDSFKAVITGDPVQARDLYRLPFFFRPTAGHLFACNELPSTSDCTDAFWDRFIVIKFNNVFRGKEGSCTRDEILSKLREEASGIMAWALAGAVRLIRNGKYTRPASTEESKKEWIADADNVAGWCEEHVTKTTPRDDAPIIDKTSNGVAYRRYHDWCRATGRKPSAQNTFFKRLKRLGHIKGRTEEERFWYFSCTETDIPISIR